MRINDSNDEDKLNLILSKISNVPLLILQKKKKEYIYASITPQRMRISDKWSSSGDVHRFQYK